MVLLDVSEKFFHFVFVDHYFLVGVFACRFVFDRLYYLDEIFTCTRIGSSLRYTGVFTHFSHSLLDFFVNSVLTQDRIVLLKFQSVWRVFFVLLCNVP